MKPKTSGRKSDVVTSIPSRVTSGLRAESINTAPACDIGLRQRAVTRAEGTEIMRSVRRRQIHVPAAEIKRGSEE